MMNTPAHRAILSAGRYASLPSPAPASVKRLLKEDVPMGAVERCLAVLLSRGIAGDELSALCNLTGAQLRDALESIATRINCNEARLRRERKVRRISKREQRRETASKRSEPKTGPKAGPGRERREG